MDAAGLLWTGRRIAGKAITRLPGNPEWDNRAAAWSWSAELLCTRSPPATWALRSRRAAARRPRWQRFRGDAEHHAVGLRPRSVRRRLRHRLRQAVGADKSVHAESSSGPSDAWNCWTDPAACAGDAGPRWAAGGAPPTRVLLAPIGRAAPNMTHRWSARRTGWTGPWRRSARATRRTRGGRSRRHRAGHRNARRCDAATTSPWDRSHRARSTPRTASEDRGRVLSTIGSGHGLIVARCGKSTGVDARRGVWSGCSSAPPSCGDARSEGVEVEDVEGSGGTDEFAIDATSAVPDVTSSGDDARRRRRGSCLDR